MRFLTVSRKASEQIEKLLYTNVIGTPGKSMVYQHQKVAEKLRHIKDPFFVSLSIRNSLVATCCFCKRNIFINGEIVNAFYIRYFTFKTTYRSNARKKIYQPRENLLKKEVNQLLNGQEFGENKPHVYYAYIDPDNLRSLRLTQEFGFEAAGIFHTVFFSRFFPKRSKNVFQLKESERDKIDPWLKSNYRDYQFFCDENVFYQNGYYVIKSKGEIVAGIQATPEKWKIHELPGRNGKLLLSVISKFPLFRRLFHREFSFLSVEAILCKENHEQELERLLSDVLARHKIHTAIMCLDPGSRAYKLVKSLKPGMMRRLAKEKRLQVIVRSQEVGLPADGPTYVSAFDVM